jgi:4-amino-4-deoxy-L-arabinose transferase-like glycosyltransferase
VPDGVLILFTTLALAAGWELWQALEAQESRAAPGGKVLFNAALMGVFVTLGLLTKSVAGLLPLIVWSVFAALHLKQLLRWKVLLPVVALVALAPLLLLGLFYLPLLYAAPGAFHMAAGYEVWQKLVTDGHNNADVFWYYFRQLFLYGRAFPRIPAALALLYGLWRAKGDLRCRYLIVWVLVSLIGFTFLRSRLYWYIAPVFPAAAILLALLVSDCVDAAAISWRRKGAGKFRTVFLPAMAVLYIIIMGGLYIFRTGQALHARVRKSEIETAVVKARRLIKTKNAAVFFYCIDRTEKRFKLLNWRERYYLDLLQPNVSDTCEAMNIQKTVPEQGGLIVITAEQDLPTLQALGQVCSHTSIRLDRWRERKDPQTVTRLIMLVFGLC